MGDAEYAKVQLAANLDGISMESFCRREIFSAADYVINECSHPTPPDQVQR
jgi:hypothetical protein